MIRRRAGILWDLYEPVRLLLAVYLVIVVIGTVIEGMALAAIVPLVSGSGADGFGGFYGSLVEIVGLDPTSDQSLVVVVAILFVLRSVAQYASALIAGVMVRREAVRLQVDLFRSYLNLRWQTLLGVTQGEVNMLLSSQTEKVAGFLKESVKAVEGVTYAVGLTIVAIIVSPSNTLIAISLVGASAVATSLIATRVRTYAKSILQSSKDQAGILLQYARGVQSLRSFGVAENAVEEVEHLAVQRESLAFRSERVWALSSTLPDLMFVLALLVVVGLALRTGDGIAELGAIVALLFRVSQYLKRFSAITQLTDMLPSVQDVHRFRVLFAKSQLAPAESTADRSLPPGAITLEGLRFTYDGAPEPAVDDVSNHIRSGEFIGIVGPSGGGKSTLVSMIVGLLEPDVGRVRVGVRAGTDDERALAYVPQSPFILKGTIASNVRWFRDVDDDQILAACRAAGLGPLLDRLPQGVDTEVEQEGLTLSGGERQRLAMARALVEEPDILVLDEATSALDSESEAAIQAALGAMRGRVTVVSIAHRLATVLAADRIWVMERGAIIEDAPPQQLLGERDSRFAALSALQGIETT